MSDDSKLKDQSDENNPPFRIIGELAVHPTFEAVRKSLTPVSTEHAVKVLEEIGGSFADIDVDDVDFEALDPHPLEPMVAPLSGVEPAMHQEVVAGELDEVDFLAQVGERLATPEEVEDDPGFEEVSFDTIVAEQPPEADLSEEGGEAEDLVQPVEALTTEEPALPETELADIETVSLEPEQELAEVDLDNEVDLPVATGDTDPLEAIELDDGDIQPIDLGDTAERSQLDLPAEDEVAEVQSEPVDFGDTELPTVATDIEVPDFGDAPDEVDADTASGSTPETYSLPEPSPFQQDFGLDLDAEVADDNPLAAAFGDDAGTDLPSLEDLDSSSGDALADGGMFLPDQQSEPELVNFDDVLEPVDAAGDDTGDHYAEPEEVELTDEDLGFEPVASEVAANDLPELSLEDDESIDGVEQLTMPEAEEPQAFEALESERFAIPARHAAAAEVELHDDQGAADAEPVAETADETVADEPVQPEQTRRRRTRNREKTRKTGKSGKKKLLLIPAAAAVVIAGGLGAAYYAGYGPMLQQIPGVDRIAALLPSGTGPVITITSSEPVPVQAPLPASVPSEPGDADLPFGAAPSPDPVVSIADTPQTPVEPALSGNELAEPVVTSERIVALFAELDSALAGLTPPAPAPSLSEPVSADPVTPSSDDAPLGEEPTIVDFDLQLPSSLVEPDLVEPAPAAEPEEPGTATPEAEDQPEAVAEAEAPERFQVRDLEDTRQLIEEVLALRAEVEDLKSAPPPAVVETSLGGEAMLELARLGEQLAIFNARLQNVEARLAAQIVAPQVALPGTQSDAAALRRLEEQIELLSNNVGIVARMAASGGSTVPGFNAVTSASPAETPAPYPRPAHEAPRISDTPAEAKGFVISSNAPDPQVLGTVAKGDFVEGYGYVLEILPQPAGGKLVVMENGTVLVP